MGKVGMKQQGVEVRSQLLTIEQNPGPGRSRGRRGRIRQQLRERLAKRHRNRRVRALEKAG